MNSIFFNDEKFISTTTYTDFIKDNPGSANLNIRASGASNAVPVEGVRIIVSKDLDNYKVMFFDGYTDSSGMINHIKLPTKNSVSNDLDVPQATSYDIEAIYEPDNLDLKYRVLMYPNICLVQNINIVPSMMVISWDVD